jgi:hypothetical protein
MRKCCLAYVAVDQAALAIAGLPPTRIAGSIVGAEIAPRIG